MMTSLPWARSRGFGRLLAKETNISDLLQFLSDLDSRPWVDFVGFVPAEVRREEFASNNADLLLIGEDGRRAVIEVKLGHNLGDKQQAGYEKLPDETGLYLAALTVDAARLAEGLASRWSFLSLAELFAAWTGGADVVARTVAAQVARILSEWDDDVAAVLTPYEEAGAKPLAALNQKFLARGLTRQIEFDLRGRGLLASAGVTSGGGLPLVQAWRPIRDEGDDRCFMAEVRWWDGKPGGELRFGVDFWPRPGQLENEDVRRAAFDLACSMDSFIEFAAISTHLANANPRLAGLLDRKTMARPSGKGDWEQVILHGFAGAVLPGGKRNTRRSTQPAFYGDGALRFQAIVDIDFMKAGGRDVTELLEATLAYLVEKQPR
ncbi:hypothetical protein [Arthrobacter sp. UYCo732]|uniref:hypothetical protein n=1 Tax=Arthrobacter sp. UYCo732 TaxID=3156336 RepID=UPI00339AF1CE